MTIESILEQRGQVYGVFASHACLSQELKEAMRQTPGWEQLAPDMKEALEMVQHKVARILNGNPEHADSWVDVAGYATLVAGRLAVQVKEEA